MHPRTQYLADAGKNRDPALQPLLQDISSRTNQEAAAEPSASNEKGSRSAAPSAPPLSTATSSAFPSAVHTPSAYGLPTGYQAQYAGATSMPCRSCLAWQVLLGKSCLVRPYITSCTMLLFLFAAEAPPELQSIRSPTQAGTAANQPVQQSYRMQTLGSFDDEPAIITCTQCRATGQTYTYKVPTVYGLSVYVWTGT